MPNGVRTGIDDEHCGKDGTTVTNAHTSSASDSPTTGTSAEEWESQTTANHTGQHLW